MKKILVVEDDVSICQELKKLLKGAGYEAFDVKNIENPLPEILSAHADLLLLDITLPGLSGEEILRQLRKESDLPVIMVTSKTAECDEVLSMSYGADDYVTKPYHPTILLLRIAAVLRRGNEKGETVGYHDCVVDYAKGSIYKSDSPNQAVVLTKNEMVIFQVLLENMGKIVSRDALMTALWDNEEYINDNALTVNISRLRSKLSDFFEGETIETRKKQGYILK